METNFSSQTVPNMPPELSGPLPRRIRRSAGSRYIEIAIALVLGLSLLLILWIGKGMAQQMRQRSALRQAGVKVSGKITRIESVPRSMDLVSYTFVVNGRTFSGKAGVPARVERNLHESDPLMVRYLPSDPTINHPAAWEWPLSGLFGIIPLLILSSLLVLFPALAYRERQLLARGKPGVAVVTRCTPGKTSFSLKYEFSPETGTTVKGSGWSGIRREIGESIWILYMPQNPGRNNPYPFPDHKVAQ